MVLTGNACFHVFVIGIQGKLEVTGIVHQKMEIIQHGCGILCSEYDTVHHIGRQRDPANPMMVHGIAGADKAFFQRGV